MSEFLESLPEQLREAPWLKDAETADEAVAKLAHAAKLVGTSVRIPEADAADDVKDQFYQKLSEIDGVARLPLHDDIDGVVGLLKKLGYPEDHTGYSLPEVDDFTWDESMGESLRQYAHKAGMTPGQFDAFAKQIAGQEAEASLLSETEKNDARKALRMDWGDTLEERESLIRGWMEHSNAPDSMKTLLADKNLPPDTMNWLLSVANQFKDVVSPLTADGKGGPTALTPVEAQIEISKVLTDMTDMRDSDPRYQPLKEKLVTLHRLAKPGQAA